MLWAHVFCPQIGKSHWSLLPNTLNSPVLATRRLESPLLRHQKRSPVQQVTQEGYPLTSVQVVGSQVHCKTFFPFLSVYVCVCVHVSVGACMPQCAWGRGEVRRRPLRLHPSFPARVRRGLVTAVYTRPAVPWPVTFQGLPVHLFSLHRSAGSSRTLGI